ncbi:HAUS augmin-like complex subunit 1 [Chanos chanos]|uniref:HAUS augmin-like complex subunit 1 n=1 Tax=Chanos chanos TaxID=29144 RepID=A0A6J2V3W8_CHACN|nr:HAUS augmin-like complex subunit 1 [Chanos chanos]
MCEKTKKVNRWLGSVFGDQPVPEFEVNTRTVDLLCQLVESSELRCKEVSLLVEDRKQKAAEYHSDGAHLQEILLQGVGLSPGSMSKHTSDLLSVLEGVTMALRVKDTALGSYIPAINKLTNELAEAEKTDRRLERDISALRKKMAATLVLRKTLQEDLQKTIQAQEVEAAKAEERLLNMDFVKNKSRDLSYRNKVAEDQLASRQMDSTVTHQAILELSEKIATLKQELLPLTKKLEPYSDLSPSPSLAQVKIEEAKRELAAVDAALEQKVDIMNSSLPKQKSRVLK